MSESNHLRYSALSKKEKAIVKRTTECISLKIKIRRHELGISQEKLSEMLDLSVGTIKGIEQNLRSPSLVTLIRIAKALKMSLSLISDEKAKIAKR